MNRIDKKFKDLKKQNKKAFIVFITAGYPDLDITRKLIFEFARVGADIIELGVPFSDPLADGPIIQEASEQALKKKVNLNSILNLVKEVRREIDIPICLMTYFNPVFCFGENRFIKKAHKSGVDGVIIPDLIPEEGRLFIKEAKKQGVNVICFISPTTTLERIRFVSKKAGGFIYYVSLTGVTGPRQALPSDLIKNIKLIKTCTDKPVCVGFGVSQNSQVKEIQKIADGVIVGSAVVKEIKDNIGRDDLVKKVGEFLWRLKK
ncbi:MAG: tryptophan synthase subunit alpha [Candidatus Omnitrophota bacterium]|nr:tryptophan synthase subunit alpha [Candidatus Omnitrophota bacterium]